MRFLVLSILHFTSVVAVLACFVLFALPWTATTLPLNDRGLFWGLGIYWFFLPALIGVGSGVIIDWISRRWGDKNYYPESKWAKTRRRTAVMLLLGSAAIYAHFWLQTGS